MRVVVTGASGRLGAYLLREACRRGHDVHAWTRTLGARPDGGAEAFDLCDPEALRARFEAAAPALVIHAAAMADPAQCYREPELAEALNHEAAAALAAHCAAAGVGMVAISTDMVFDGEHAPYAEDDVPRPRSVYGETKRRGEEAVLRWPGLAVARMSLLYGPRLTRRASFFDEAVTRMREGRPLRLFEDEYRAALSLRIAAATLLDLGERRVGGIFHVAGERMSRWELGRRIAAGLGLPDAVLERGRRADFEGPEPRQRDLTLTRRRLEEALPGWSPGEVETEVRDMMEAAPRDIMER